VYRTIVDRPFYVRNPKSQLECVASSIIEAAPFLDHRAVAADGVLEESLEVGGGKLRLH
jgi:hypothetical protein